MPGNCQTPQCVCNKQIDARTGEVILRSPPSLILIDEGAAHRSRPASWALESSSHKWTNYALGGPELLVGAGLALLQGGSGSPTVPCPTLNPQVQTQREEDAPIPTTTSAAAGQGMCPGSEPEEHDDDAEACISSSALPTASACPAASPSHICDLEAKLKQHEEEVRNGRNHQRALGVLASPCACTALASCLFHHLNIDTGILLMIMHTFTIKRYEAL